MAKDLLVVWHNMSSGDTNVQHIIILDWNKEHLILIHALSKELSVFKWLGIFMLYQEYAICGRQKSAIFYWVLHQQKNNKKSWHLISDEASSMEARKQSKESHPRSEELYVWVWRGCASSTLPCDWTEVLGTGNSTLQRKGGIRNWLIKPLGTILSVRALNSTHSLPSALRWIWSLYWK